MSQSTFNPLIPLGDVPPYTPEEALTRQTFLALMWSLSYPGRAYTLPTGGTAAFHAIVDTLVDLETSYYTSAADLSDYLSRSGARAFPPDHAEYHFYPTLTTDLLEIIKTASTGSLLYPDQSATLFIGCRFGQGETYTLSGPGIPPNTTQTLTIDGIPAAFWTLRQSVARYPRGWDIYLIDDDQVVGLPRTTSIL